MKEMKTKIKAACVGLILVVAILGVSSISASAGKVLLGDVDGNGKVTSSDARTILRYSARLDSSSDLSVADVDQNGKVNSRDARLALRITARLEPERVIEEGTTDPFTELESNMRVVTDESCPYCGRPDCPALAFDAKLGATVFKTENAALCPEYVKPTETETTTESEPIPEPCEYCGSLIGHNDQCPLYDKHSDASLYCQDCHLPLGFGPDKCVQFNQDITCSECGQLVPAWTCHHCSGR